MTGVVKKKWAVVYARVSDKKQADRDISIPAQVERAYERSEQLGASVVKTFVDEGLSGTADNRPAFQNAISYCETHEITYLITWSTSRFTRNVFDAAIYKRRLLKAGVVLVYISQSIDSTTDDGWLSERFAEIIDEAHSRRTSADTLRSMIKNAKDGYYNGGNPPFGYVAAKEPENQKKKRLQIIEQEASVVREIFRLRLTGIGGLQIAAQLNNRGLTNRQKAWNKSSITALLRNQAMIGDIVYGRRDKRTGKTRPKNEWIIVKSHQPIIDQETWNAVQSTMDALDYGTGNNRGQNIFTGLLYCHCGSSLQVETATSQNGTRYSYYRCRRAQKKEGCDHARRIPVADLEAYLVDIVLAKALNRDNLLQIINDMNEFAGEWKNRRNRELSSLQKSINALEKSNESIYRTIEAAETAEVDPVLLLKRLDQNNTKINGLISQVDELESMEPPKVRADGQRLSQLAQYLSDIIKNKAERSQVRAFMGGFIEKVLIGDSTVRIEYDPNRLVCNAEPALVHSGVNWLPERYSIRTGLKVVKSTLPQRFARRAA